MPVFSKIFSRSAVLASIAFALLTACSSGSSDPTTVAGEFSANGVKGTISGQNVALDLSGLGNCATTIENMVIDINANGASISPDPRVARDYSQPVQFTLTAPDGTKAVYTVTVKGAECLQTPTPTPTTPTGPALADVGPLLDHGGNPITFNLNALTGLPTGSVVVGVTGFPAVDDFANQTNLNCDASGTCTATYDVNAPLFVPITFPVTVEVRVPNFTNTLKRPLNIIIENEF